MRYAHPGQPGAVVSFKSAYGNFIDGRFVEPLSGEFFMNTSPVDGSNIAQFPRSDARDIDFALDAAHRAAPAWGKTSVQQRSRLLLQVADRIEQHLEYLAVAESWDNGKPIRETLNADLPLAVDHFRYFAGCLRAQEGSTAEIDETTVAYHFHEPLGVVGQIIPWNFPLLLACWKLGPALAAGNSVILKPSEKSPLTALRLAGLAKEAGLPDGVLNVVSGFGHEAGQALALHPDVEVITFTGSTRTGKQLLKDAGDSNMKRVWLEAGGKSANIVFADCPDLQQAVRATAGGIFYNQGQVCIAGTRLLLEESIADEFLARLKAEAQHWQPGNPLDPDTTMGMLIDNTHADNVHSFIRGGESQSTLFLDGRKNPWPAAVGPTIFVDVDPASTLSREEIFGPVLVVTRFKSEEEALKLANDSDYGLGAAVWTRDLSRAHRMSRRLKAGSVFVNNYNDGDMTVPFGGYKQSGNGRDKSLHALEKFTELKTIWIALES